MLTGAPAVMLILIRDVFKFSKAHHSSHTRIQASRLCSAPTDAYLRSSKLTEGCRESAKPVHLREGLHKTIMMVMIHNYFILVP